MSSKNFPSDNEMRLMQATWDKGIILAQKRLVERAKHDGFTLISCQDGHTVTERDPRTIVF